MKEALHYSSDIGQIIEPNAISYSFNTPGWYMLAGLVLLSLLIWGGIRWRIYAKNAYRREALQMINSIAEQQHTDPYYAINRVLKIMCIQLFGRREVAALYGKEWFSFLLSKTTAEQQTEIYPVESFSKAIYNPRPKEDAQAFNDFATFWILNHRA